MILKYDVNSSESITCRMLLTNCHIFQIKVWDFDEASPPDLIGECITTLGQMKKIKKEMVQFDLINPKKQVD